MKKINPLYFSLLLITVGIFSCEVDDTKVTFLGGTAPVLTLSSTNDMVLTKDKENYTALQFQWTNPNFEFSNGTSTQDVYYTLQIDTTGSGFTNPKLNNIAYTKEVGHTFTVKELNTALSILELKDYAPHNFEFRVKATLANNKEPQYSNVIKVKISTYLDVVYPVPDKLFITGAATPKDWMGGGDAEVPSQKFTKINAYLFVISSLQIKASSPFLFVPVYGNWDNKYGFTGDAQKNNPSGDGFKPAGNDLISPATAGTYKITVNFKTGKYSFE